MVSEEERTQYVELSYYTLSHSSNEFIHQYIVDASAAQWADASTKPITLTFALAGLYLHVEKHYTGKEIQRAHMHLAKQKKSWPVWDIPIDRGQIRVADVLHAKAGSERDTAVDLWSQSVWSAYAEQQEKVATFVESQLGKIYD